VRGYPATWHPPVHTLPPGVESAYSRVGSKEARMREFAVPGGRVVRGSLQLLPEGAPLGKKKLEPMSRGDAETRRKEKIEKW
jgi:hypothetical protein